MFQHLQPLTGHGRRRQVAAAALLVLDKDAVTHAWSTVGDAWLPGVRLTHDSWDPDNKLFPPEAFIRVRNCANSCASDRPAS